MSALTLSTPRVRKKRCFAWDNTPPLDLTGSGTRMATMTGLVKWEKIQ
jgi:hypothetical protein